MFQSTHPCGVRRIAPCTSYQRTEVSIHAPLRGATRNHLDRHPQVDVSIHAPLRGATKNPSVFQSVRKFQSTHPCGVRPRPQRACPPQVCFNPRTPAGCDKACRKDKRLAGCFNPRTPAGCDPYVGIYMDRGSSVSIHAPLRGATFDSASVSFGYISFNPRTPAGCDEAALKDVNQSAGFQSTHPCGVRHGWHFPAGLRHAVSIHAPLRGATSDAHALRSDAGVSIHAPLRGATSLFHL